MLTGKEEVTQSMNCNNSTLQPVMEGLARPKPFPKRDRPQIFLNSIPLLTPTPLCNFDLTMKLLRRVFSEEMFIFPMVHFRPQQLFRNT